MGSFAAIAAQSLCRRAQDRRDRRAALLELIIVDVGALAFRKPEKKYGAVASPIGDQRAEPAALALSWPRHALLDEPAAEIGSVDAITKTISKLKESIGSLRGHRRT